MSDTHAQTVPFVRDTMLPPAEPPVREAGAVRWLRENLFSGPVNTVLTIVGILIVWFLVSRFWDWFAHGVWNADSLADCRQIIAETWGEGARGACWAVIRERWNQYVYGFYPSELYWRPTMAFGLLFLALAPVLFSESPGIRRIVLSVATVLTLWLMVWLGAPAAWLVFAAVVLIGGMLVSERHVSWLLVFSILYPLMGVWFLWGGSAWGPIMVLIPGAGLDRLADAWPHFQPSRGCRGPGCATGLVDAFRGRGRAGCGKHRFAGDSRCRIRPVRGFPAVDHHRHRRDRLSLIHI